MAIYNAGTIKNYITKGNNGANTAVKGKAFENLICYLFKRVPGVEITKRNSQNIFHTEEIDIAIWNNMVKKGLFFLPNIFLIECKNWSNPVSSMEVNWFADKLHSRGRDFGILIANNGITGNTIDLTAAHSIIAKHLALGRQIIVLNMHEIKKLKGPEDLIKLIKEKLCILTVSGGIN